MKESGKSKLAIWAAERLKFALKSPGGGKFAKPTRGNSPAGILREKEDKKVERPVLTDATDDSQGALIGVEKGKKNKREAKK